MTRPAWLVDPAAPAVPDVELEPCDEGRGWLAVSCPDHGTPRGLLDELHTLRTRYLIAEHRCRRLAAAAAAAALALAAPPEPAPPRHKGGHPGHRARNDRLLALYETTTPARLSHLQRCRLAAAALAREDIPGERTRVLPAATARDAIAEARRHRDELASPQLFTDEDCGAD